MNPLNSSSGIGNVFFMLFIILFTITAVIIITLVIFYLLLLWYRSRKRESDSLDSTLIQVSVPRENEIKIDAAEQLFSSFASINKSTFFKLGASLSFEVVGLPGDIRFYVNTPNKVKDYVEKQINGAYPDAEIMPLTEEAAKQKVGFIVGNEYNIFSIDGKVAFASLGLKHSNYLPIKVFKELAVDSMSSVTSTLAKMNENEDKKNEKKIKKLLQEN